MYLSPVHIFVEGGLINKGRGIIKYFEVTLSCFNTKEMYVDLDNDPVQQKNIEA